jgi:hypothetical protein
MFETVLPGFFAAGDIREPSTTQGIGVAAGTLQEYLKRLFTLILKKVPGARCDAVDCLDRIAVAAPL